MDAYITLLLLVIIFLFCLLLMWRRDKTVWTNRMKAIDKTAEYTHWAIFSKQTRRPIHAVDEFWSIYHSYPSYQKQLFSLHKWSFDALFPDLEKKLEAKKEEIKGE